MVCPFLEQADPRCADHFSLINIADAFSHCVGRHQACPVYQRLLTDRLAGRHRTAAGAPVLPVRLVG